MFQAKILKGKSAGKRRTFYKNQQKKNLKGGRGGRTGVSGRGEFNCLGWDKTDIRKKGKQKELWKERQKKKRGPRLLSKGKKVETRGVRL